MSGSRANGWIRAAVVVSVAAGIGIGAAVYGDAGRLVGASFPGFGVFPSGTVALRAASPRADFARGYGVRPRDRVTHVAGVPTPDGAAVLAAVRGRPAGEPVVYRFERGDDVFERTIPVQTFTRGDFRRLVPPLLVGGLLVLLAGAIGVLARPELAATRVLFLFCWSLVVNLNFLAPDFSLVHRFMPWSFLITTPLSKATLLHLGLTFPQRLGPRGVVGRRLLLAAIYGAMFLQGALYVSALGRAPHWNRVFDEIAYATYTGGFLLFVANVVWTLWRSPSEPLRQQARVVLVGPGMCLLLLAGMSASAWLAPVDPAPLLGASILAAVFAVSLTYGLLRHNLFEFDAVLRRGLAAGIVLGGGALLYLGVFVGLRALLGEPAAWVSVALALGLAILGIPTFAPLRARAERLVAEHLFPGAEEARAMLAKAGPRLAAARDGEATAWIVRDLVSEGLHAAEVRVLRRGMDDELVDLLAPREPLGPAEFLDALADTGGVDLDGAGAGPPASLRSKMERLGVRALAPFPPPARGDAIPGALALSARSDGRLYTSEDVLHLEAVAAQTSIALANAQAWEHVRELQQRLVQENAWLREEIEVEEAFAGIIGEAQSLRQALAQVEQVAPTDATVLFSGETGTGKELLVRALHARSKRSDQPLVKIACAAIPETLLESELFGHEKGAFTGAARAKEGRFEAAHRGALFFDDVDTLPLAIQAKLLRAIQEGEIQRLASPEVRKVDVRVIAATNRDLLAEVRAGRFREDLYYRLHVVPIEIPPLRERREDIAALARHFAELEARKAGREPRPLSRAAMASLEVYDWPGNVRELRNVIERAVVLSRGGEVELPEALGNGALSVHESDREEAGTLAAQVREFKRALIAEALEASGGNQRIAAERLGLHRQSLTRMLRALEGESGK